jgi:hypothetical protein
MSDVEAISSAETQTKPNNNESKWLTFFLLEFKKESDRAAVILTAAMLDEALKDLLEAFLVPCPSSEDKLFDGASAPMSSFSSRIECAYRLGLISRDFSRCIHIVRRIRNAFAHDVAGCTFAAHSVSSRVDALRTAMKAPKKAKKTDLTDPRVAFSYLCGYFLWQLKGHTRAIQRVDDRGAICCVLEEEVD